MKSFNQLLKHFDAVSKKNCQNFVCDMQQASRTRLQSRKDVIHLELTTVVAVFFFSGCEVKLKFREKKLQNKALFILTHSS